jgi:hypothetical protein
LLGTAGGGFAITGGTLITATGSVGGATLGGTFSWWRIGISSAISLTGLVITAPGTGAINLDDTTLAGEGAAVFTWGSPTGTCAAAVTNQGATVAGVALQPA